MTVTIYHVHPYGGYYVQNRKQITLDVARRISRRLGYPGSRVTSDYYTCNTWYLSNIMVEIETGLVCR